jgi:hypothetical protein
MLTSPNRSRESREAALAYRVCPNGRAGNWYWEVIRRGAIVARGLAPTRVRARADAITAAAAASRVEGQSEDDPPPL